MLKSTVNPSPVYLSVMFAQTICKCFQFLYKLKHGEENCYNKPNVQISYNYNWACACCLSGLAMHTIPLMASQFELGGKVETAEGRFVLVRMNCCTQVSTWVVSRCLGAQQGLGFDRCSPCVEWETWKSIQFILIPRDYKLRFHVFRPASNVGIHVNYGPI